MVDVVKMRELIKAGGATLNASGEPVSFRAGYQVSRQDCFTLSVRFVNRITAAVNELLSSCPAGAFVGLWVDAGRVYVDISERIDSLRGAIVAGLERKQKSIFDWVFGRCISLEG